MRMFVIYKHPRDFADKWVVREWSIGEPQDERWRDMPDSGTGICARISPHSVCETLEKARESVPGGFVQTFPNAADDPVIHEVWL